MADYNVEREVRMALKYYNQRELLKALDYNRWVHRRDGKPNIRLPTSKPKSQPLRVNRDARG